eukprot:s46_g45.t1
MFHRFVNPLRQFSVPRVRHMPRAPEQLNDLGWPRVPSFLRQLHSQLSRLVKCRALCRTAMYITPVWVEKTLVLGAFSMTCTNVMLLRNPGRFRYFSRSAGSCGICPGAWELAEAWDSEGPWTNGHFDLREVSVESIVRSCFLM